MVRRATRYALLASALAVAAPASAEEIVSARYSEPTQRYGHFALGRPHEYARITAMTSAGRSLSMALPVDEVFEDAAPRLIRLGASAKREVLAVVSQRDAGSRLVVIGVSDGGLEATAQSRPVGTAMRWMNPVGVADLDGDGISEVAAVTTPHIGGTLRIYRKSGAHLVEIAALAGFSNHVYGSPEVGLSAMLPGAGGTSLLVPDNTRRVLRLIALRNGRLVEVGRCALAAPVLHPTDVKC